MDEDLSLIGWLRRIQQSWEVDIEGLSRLSHVPVDRLSEYLALTSQQILQHPTVPEPIANAVPLVALFRSIQEIYPDPIAQNDWLKRPNSVLEDQIPVEVIALSPEHLAYVSYVVESGIRLQARA